MITRLSKPDTASLHAESSKTSAHAVALIILEASDRLTHERLHQLITASLPQLARFRSRLVGKPLGLGQPVWAEIDDYDPTAQTHRAAVRPPGGPREFSALIAQLSMQRRPRHQPLWEAWSIQGLAGGRWALAIKMSPVLSERSDAALSVWSSLLTEGPYEKAPGETPAETTLGSAPSVSELVRDLVVEIVEIHATGAWLIAGAAVGALRAFRRRARSNDRLDRVPSAVTSMTRPVPRTMFNAPLTRRRALAFASVSGTDVNAVSTAFGGSAVNVLLAACTLSLRAWLQHYDSVPADPLLVRVPLSPLAPGPVTAANPLIIGLLRLPVQLDDPVQILTNLHTATERLATARREELETDDVLTDFATLMSLARARATNTATQPYARNGLGGLNASNCHGSVSYQSGLSGNTADFCAGARVVGTHTVTPLLEGGFSITFTSRTDVIDLCLCVCPDNVPGVDDLATGIADSINLLVAAAQKSPRGQGRSVVTEMTSHVEKRSHTRRYR